MLLTLYLNRRLSGENQSLTEVLQESFKSKATEASEQFGLISPKSLEAFAEVQRFQEGELVTHCTADSRSSSMVVQDACRQVPGCDTIGSDNTSKLVPSIGSAFMPNRK